VCQDVGRCSRGVAIYNKPATNEELGEWGRDEDEQVQGACDSGLETRRRFNGSVCHFGSLARVTVNG